MPPLWKTAVSLIRLPICPSTNGLFKSAGRLRVVSDAYEAWRTLAGLKLNLHRVEPFGRAPVQIDISVNEDLKGDIDNRIKAPLDLLVKHGIIEDDRFVRRVSIERANAAIVPKSEMLLSILPVKDAQSRVDERAP